VTGCIREARGQSELRQGSQAQIHRLLLKLQKGKGMDSPLKLPEGKQPSQNTEFRLLISITVIRINLDCFKPLNL
jgi:hypothetical protein